MGKFKNLSKILAILAVIVLVLFGYQNCQQSNLPMSSINNPTLTGGGDNGVQILLSNSATFNPQTNTYVYGDKLYQKVKGLGSGASGCIDELRQAYPLFNNYTCETFATLGPNIGWNYNSTTDEWVSSAVDLKPFHGRIMRLQYKSNGNQTIYTRHIQIQSIASANTTEVMFFMSADKEGLDVVGPNLPQNFAFYSQIKNGLGSDYFCQYVKTNSDGSLNPTDPCKNTIPPNAAWILLGNYPPVDNGGNTSLRTYSNAENQYHITNVDNYIYRAGQKYGPFQSNFLEP
ncbi:MAG: hypothetical protein IPM57_06545 [Oligoflexia bacterium]|nr:hypothetical protein [Oligoflexia bacterium]